MFSKPRLRELIGRHIVIASLACGIVIAGAYPAGLAQHADEDAHDQASSSASVAEVPDDHSGDGEDDHDEDVLVELTPAAIQMAGIQRAQVRAGRIGASIHVPGEVGFDEDRLVHVVPRFAGIAKETRYRIGDKVKPGDVLAIIEGNVSMNTYTIEAPIAGWIIERHVTPGEFVNEEDAIYVIADLSRVWVNLAVYPRDADKIAPGQTVTLHAIGSDLEVQGTVDYLTPVLDARTRSMTARIVLPNPDNRWRPGTFVHADVVTAGGDERLLVDKDAVQILDDEHVVFVPEGDVRFRPVHVVVGGSDTHSIEILAGLEPGAEYIAEGAFELKAKIVTSALGGHAGHGH